ncbi:MAG: HD domain-containing phosphohydrolase [Thermodesulfobacteriota bacterium]
MRSEISSILIIDDKETGTGLMKAALESLDWSVVEINDARQGLNMVFEIDPDIIFLAVEGDGYYWPQILSQISRKAPDRPVITFFTGKPVMDDISLSFQMGAFDCLSFSPAAALDLGQTVNRALKEARRRRRERTARERFEKSLRESEQTIARLLSELQTTRKSLADEQNRRLCAEQAARQNQQTFQIMFENTRDAIIHLNRDGFVVNTNGTVLDVFGLRPDEVMGKDLSGYEFLGCDYRQALELYKNAPSDVPFPAFEVEAFHKNGHKIYIETQAKQMITDNACDGIINIIRDITPQKRLENTKNATILGLAKLAESRDDSTGRHLERVREYARLITQAISRLPKYARYITPAYIKDIYLSSILHDIGKVSIPDAILLKPGRLSPEEFDIIKQHTLVGGDALAAVDAELKEQSFLTLGKEIAYYHHESWNGRGYPRGLEGEEIPLSARIVALADVYDALTTRRIYKDAYSHEESAAIILEERGQKFDPDIVDAFGASLEEFDRVRRRIDSRDKGCRFNEYTHQPGKSYARQEKTFRRTQTRP